MKRIKQTIQKRERRKARTRSKIFGTASKPRLSVFRSNKHLYAQLIDDEYGRTMAQASSKSLDKKTGSKSELALEVGKRLGEAAKKLGIGAAVFDRGAYKFHGRVKAVAEGARQGGLKI